MEIDKYYEGREHSAIKHELLKGYLEKLLFIIGISGVKEITYVDCFARPWGDESDMGMPEEWKDGDEQIREIRKVCSNLDSFGGSRNGKASRTVWCAH